MAANCHACRRRYAATAGNEGDSIPLGVVVAAPAARRSPLPTDFAQRLTDAWRHQEEVEDGEATPFLLFPEVARCGLPGRGGPAWCGLPRRGALLGVGSLGEGLLSGTCAPLDCPSRVVQQPQCGFPFSVCWKQCPVQGGLYRGAQPCTAALPASLLRSQRTPNGEASPSTCTRPSGPQPTSSLLLAFRVGQGA